MFPHSSHIARKGRVYYYRRRLPRPGVGEVTLSLRTRNFREAQHLASLLDLRFLALALEGSGVTVADQMRRVLSEELQRCLADSLQRIRRTPQGQSYYCEDFRSAEPEVVASKLVEKHALPEHYRENLLWEDFDWSKNVRSEDDRFARTLIDWQQSEIAQRYVAPSINERARELIEKHKLPGELLPDLAFDLAQVRLQVLEKERQWLLRGPVETVPQASSVPERDPVPLAAQIPGSKVAPLPTGPKLSELLPDFMDVMTWRGQTRMQNGTTYRMFMEVCGDRPPSEYGSADLSAFYDLLRKLPALYSKSPQWRDLGLAQIAAIQHGPDVPRLTMKTMKRHFSALGKMFGHFKRRGLIKGDNPAHGWEFPQQGRANQKRSMWEGEELRKLFDSPVWTGSLSLERRTKAGPHIYKDERYWLPLLGLFHGARLEELAQLKCADVQCSGGIWFLNIAEGDGQQLKNQQSTRRVPIHPRIMELGFLAYVEGVGAGGAEWLFNELERRGPDEKLGVSIGKWFTYYRKQIGVYRKGLDFHSFRRGVITKLIRAGVTAETRRAITGHEGKGVDEVVYFDGFLLADLRGAIEKVEWPEVDHLL